MSYYRFATVWVLLFAMSFTALSSLGIAPKNILQMNRGILTFLTFAKSASANETVAGDIAAGENVSAPTENDASIRGIEPEKIVIEKIGVSSVVVNPETADIRVLDEELKKGVVRYPGSGYLNETSNVFLFGHSTGLTNVHNKAYQALNNLDKLNIGDVVKIYAGNEVYEYSVVSLSLAKAQESLVTFSHDKKMLTLSTCNTFGKKEDRFVVTAVFVKQLVVTENK